MIHHQACGFVHNSAKDKDLLLSCIDEGKLTLANDMSIPYISGACNAGAKIKLSEDNMAVYDGLVNGELSVLQSSETVTESSREF